MKFKSVLIIFALLSSTSASADEKVDVVGVLVAAKMSGACGILGGMASFQETTKMPGGNEFLSRFLATEAARLGFTVDEYIGQCKKAIALYDAMTGDELNK